MKLIAVLLVVVAAVAAEPPRYGFARLRSQRQEAAPAPDSNTDEAPYPPSGWRPAGPKFILPARQLAPAQTYAAPTNTYGAPNTQYGAPNTQYGAPDTQYGVPFTTEPSVETTTNPEEGSTENSDAESLAVAGLDQGQQNAKQAEVQSNTGAYYLLLPDSTLQRVDYMTENDLRNMAYTARLQYRNEQPAPIYSYSPQQYIQLA